MKNVSKILFFLTLIITACKQQQKCAAFDDENIAAFTYAQKDTLSFINQVNEHFEIYISSIQLSEAYTYTCKNIDQVCPCTSNVQALATDTKTNTPYTFLEMELSSVSSAQIYKYKLQNFQFDFDFINELPYIDQMEYLTHFDSMTINNNIYEDVILVINSHTDSSAISQVYFTQKEGIIQFTNGTTNDIWTLQN